MSPSFTFFTVHFSGSLSSSRTSNATRGAGYHEDSYTKSKNRCRAARATTSSVRIECPEYDTNLDDLRDGGRSDFMDGHNRTGWGGSPGTGALTYGCAHDHATESVTGGPAHFCQSPSTHSERLCVPTHPRSLSISASPSTDTETSMTDHEGNALPPARQLPRKRKRERTTTDSPLLLIASPLLSISPRPASPCSPSSAGPSGTSGTASEYRGG